jgi:hypothetical protein
VNFGEHLLSEGVASASAHEEGGASCAPSDLAPVLWVESFQAHSAPILQIAGIYQTVSLFLLLHYEDNAGLEARLPII